MIKHKCSYKAFADVLEVVTLATNVWGKILRTPFNQFLNFRRKITVDSALLDDNCQRWKSGIRLNGNLGGGRVEQEGSIANK